MHIKNVFLRMNAWMKVAIAILFLIFVFSIIFFARGIIQARHWGMHPHNPLGNIFSRSWQTLWGMGINDIDTIDTWMTFSYINIAFHLPDSLLRDALNIDLPQYPNISLKSYIRKKNLDNDAFLLQVKEIIRASFAISPRN